MPLLHDNELSERIAALLADVGALHTVAALGFVETDEGRLAANLSAVAASARWSYVDLAALQVTEQLEQLSANLQAPILVLRCPRKAPVILQHLIDATMHQRPSVEMGRMQMVPRLATQSVIALLPGCSNIGDVDPAFVKIPYWEFLP